MGGPPDISSKHPARRSENEFYRYYAGYPIEFAEWVIDRLGLKESAILFDPWNGSGTTVAACAKKGLSAKGFDLNPVMVHLGRARISASDVFDEARSFLTEIGADKTICDNSDIGDLAATIQSTPVTSEAVHSVLLAALYPRAPELLGFVRSKNPSWYQKSSEQPNSSLRGRALVTDWIGLVESLQKWSVQADASGAVLTVERADSRKAYAGANMFDGIITSPPYLTRIDYIKATLPEFSLISLFEGVPDTAKIRKSMVGTPLTNRQRIIDVSHLPERVKLTLSMIKSHRSKASQTYYFNFFASYFLDLSASLRRIARALKPGAVGCFVVQPTSYKEILVDLPLLLLELAKLAGLEHIDTVEFSASRSMSLVNSKAHASARKPKSEFAVFVRRI